MTFAEPVSELIRNVSQPFECARSMPPGVYRSPEFLERELTAIFAREWICVGRASALPNPATTLTYELAGQPIFVIRDRDGDLRALSNVCLHRMSTLLEGARPDRRVIVCPYHAWTYNLDGTLRGAPAMIAERRLSPQGCYRLPRNPLRGMAGLGLRHARTRRRAAGRRAARRGRRPDRRLRHGDLRRDLLRDPRLGHQLEGAGRELHGELSPAGLPRGDHRRLLEARRDGLPAGAGGFQLPHDPQGRLPEDRPRAPRRTPG